ncbi:MAG: hypothetical protein SGBAC_009643 [Bacillariaceae sp.]
MSTSEAFPLQEMFLEPWDFVPFPEVPDHPISASWVGESFLNTTCTTQSPRMSYSKKGYQCTYDLMLPPDFEPSAYSVICGRRRKAIESIGNRRLNVIASIFAKRYADAKKKEDKSVIVSEILNTIRSASPDSQHAFVRYENGQWFRVQNLHAREKIGSVLRDTLSSKYRSSTKSKMAKRKTLKKNVMLQERTTR